MEYTQWIVMAYLAVIFYVRNAFLVLYSLVRKNARDVEFSCEFFEDNDIESKGVILETPFFDEKKHLSVRWRWDGIEVGYTPYESMTEVIRKVCADSYLIQTVFDDILYPAPASLKGVVERLQANGIEVVNGALVYTPASLSKDAHRYGITEGTDGFYLCRQFTHNIRSVFEAHVEELQEVDGDDAYVDTKIFLNASGQLSKRFQTWSLTHQDEGFIRRFVNEVFAVALRKACAANRVKLPDSFVTPKLEDIFPGFVDFNGPACRIQVYFEDTTLVVFLRSSKGCEVYTYAVDEGCFLRRAKESFVSYLIPEVARNKPYTKKSLKRFGFKFLVLAVYLAGFMLGVNHLVFNVWHVRAPLLTFLTCFALPVLISFSVVLAVYYLIYSVFGKKALICIEV